MIVDTRKIIEAVHHLSEISLQPGDDAYESIENASMLLEEARTNIDQLLKYIDATEYPPDAKSEFRRIKSESSKLKTLVVQAALIAKGLENDINAAMDY